MGIFDWLHRAEKLKAEEAKGAPETGLRAEVIAALRTVYDPEIPVNIYDLGLIYGLDVDEESGRVAVRMTLTAPGCPVAETFPGTVQCAVEEVAGVSEASVELVWDPPWSAAQMSEAARLELGLL
ncbi:SUF system Fe-S cluster assembly protein [Aromatoleum toluclasticum]|uniref:SUF system Fe-S cluster assembly protein n=1 Tax=Aromatoleum toluclasticum TaxID=92003 RepID=UPI00035E57EA|nr:SUF system Fe-S cluster assembly protein [Aromatoleum toluclasticum]